MKNVGQNPKTEMQQGSRSTEKERFRQRIIQTDESQQQERSKQTTCQGWGLTTKYNECHQHSQWHSPFNGQWSFFNGQWSIFNGQ